MNKKTCNHLFSSLALFISLLLILNSFCFITYTQATTSTTPKVTIESSSCLGGTKLKVPIKISNISDKGMRKFKIKFSYDPNLMDLTFIDRGDILEGLPYSVFTGAGHDIDTRTIEIGFDCADLTSPLYTDGVFSYIYFDVKSIAPTCTTLLNVVTNPTLTDASENEYANDSITLENNPINITYNPDAIKNSTISSNYLTYNTTNLNDIIIPMTIYENTITSIENTTSKPFTTLNAGTDYEVSNSTLILKKNLLTNLANKISFLTINFSAGNSQTILIKNTDLNMTSDASRISPNPSDPNVEVYDFTKDISNLEDGVPITFAVTNTSNSNMNLNKLSFDSYYTKSNPYVLDNFILLYSSILGSNKDLISSTTVQSDPFPCDWYYNENCTLNTSFIGNTVLKPNETILVHGYIQYNEKSADDFDPSTEKLNRYVLQSSVVAYNTESLYGSYPEDFKANPYVIPESVDVNSNNAQNTDIEIKLNSNLFNTIDSYVMGNIKKNLIKNEDYFISSRNTITLTKSFIESLNVKYTTLNFRFCDGSSDSVEIVNNKFSDTLNKGSLILNNPECATYGEIECGGIHFITYPSITVPINMNNLGNESIKSGTLILKYDKTIFKNAYIESLNSSIASAYVDATLGTINITLKPNYLFNNNSNILKVVLEPNYDIFPSDHYLKLTSESYYETISGKKFVPSCDFGAIQLKEKEYDYYN